MADQQIPVAARTGTAGGVAAVGVVASLTALFSAAACCVLPVLLAGAGISAGGLAAFVRYRWPLTIVAVMAVVAGCALYLRKRRVCAVDGTCVAPSPRKATLAMLCLATVVIIICALWRFIEQPLMRVLGGA